jgi:ribosome-associated protein
MAEAAPGNENRIPKDAEDRTERLALLAARLAWENRGEAIEILHVDELCSYTDYFVLATGRNRPHLRAMAGDIEAAMKTNDVPRLGREGLQAGEWMLLDFGAVIVQLFEPEARTYYQLEELWADAPRLPWEHTLPAEARGEGGDRPAS